MRPARWPIALTLLTMALAQPAMAQSRAKDERRRTEARQPASADRGERRRDPVRATTARDPERPAPPPRPRDDERERRERDRRILGPITVLSPRVDYDPYGRRHDSFHGSDRYGRYDRAGRVWRRTDGMTCGRLDDELEWAHDEWHYRNDRHRGASWYEVEHARLELRIAEERAYAGCGAARDERDCRERGHYARTGDALAVALHVLQLLLGDTDRARW